MIDYFKGAYNINLLPRVHGSALYKGSIVGLLSVVVYLAIALTWNDSTPGSGGGVAIDEREIDHPYAVGVLVTSVSFLITFRANFGYQRYWEACSKHYDGARPPCFSDHDELNTLNLTRARRRRGEPVRSSERVLKSAYDSKKEILTDDLGRTSMIVNGEDGQKTTVLSRLRHSGQNGDNNSERSRSSSFLQNMLPPQSPITSSLMNIMPPPTPITPLPNGVLTGRWDVIHPTPDRASAASRRRTSLNADYFPTAQCPNHNFASRPDGRTPPLFLQELAHLSSLACAVAFSTLRNDIEGMESPLDVYVPGAPWPVADADQLPRRVRREFQPHFHVCTIVRNWLGLDRLPGNRNRHNAARPLSVLGGISDAEILFLQKARGPHATVQLALGWLCEFITREHLEGSLGEVHSAMISRLLQFLSDGMVGYNQARNIMYIPFPFPEAQLSSFFVASMVLAVPFLMDQYTNVLWIGSMISFLTVTCLAGLHEVARELENPFKNVPNELPVCIMQAMYNEALATMFSGFNPDSFWDPEMYQGTLEAMALGKLHQKNTTDEIVPETPTSTNSTQKGATKKPPRKHVSFAMDVDTDTDVAKELWEVLAAQALEIEELGRLLSTDESSQKGGEIGKRESEQSGETGSSSSRASLAAARPQTSPPLVKPSLQPELSVGSVSSQASWLMDSTRSSEDVGEMGNEESTQNKKESKQSSEIGSIW